MMVLACHFLGWPEEMDLLTGIERGVQMRIGLIVSNPKVMGKPVVAGTRITVELILDKPGAGETIEQLLDAHPRLTRESVPAALAFAAEALRADVVYPLVEVAA
jgi:uncharacterized protein (DUF433 family)